MKRQRKPNSPRRLIVALGICSIVILLWPLSYFWSDGFRIRISGHRYELTTGPNWVAVTVGTNKQDSPGSPFFENRFTVIDAGRRSALPFTRIYSSPGDYRFYFPLWMLSAIAGLVGVAMVLSDLRRRRNYKPGCCANCGYDLRASPERCPECGAVVGR